VTVARGPGFVSLDYLMARVYPLTRAR